MEIRKSTFSKGHSGSCKKTTTRNRLCRDASGVHPVAIGGNASCRSTYRASVIEQATASRKSAIAFLTKAGILDKSGELTSLYR